MKKIFFFMFKCTLKSLHYTNTWSMFLFFSLTWCPTEIVSSRWNTYSCWSLSNDWCLFAALMIVVHLCTNAYPLFTLQISEKIFSDWTHISIFLLEHQVFLNKNCLYWFITRPVYKFSLFNPILDGGGGGG